MSDKELKKYMEPGSAVPPKCLLSLCRDLIEADVAAIVCNAVVNFGAVGRVVHTPDALDAQVIQDAKIDPDSVALIMAGSSNVTQIIARDELVLIHSEYIGDDQDA